LTADATGRIGTAHLIDREDRIRFMANTPQSKKRARQNARRHDINKARRSRIRTFLRKVEEAIASGDQAAARVALQAAQPELMRGVTKGIVHKNTAARKMSRLSSRVKALAA
jgi:small subunit ribosomal protein S20